MRDDYRENGFVKIPGLLTRDDASMLVRQIHDIFELRMNRLGLPVERELDGRVRDECLFSFFDQHHGAYVECLRTANNLPLIFEIGSRETMIAAVQAAGVNFPVFCARPIITLSSARTARHHGHWKTRPHQDWRSMQGSLNSVVVWIALRDVSEELGRLEVAPGSHKLGLLPTVPDEWYRRLDTDLVLDSNFVPVNTDAGDALVFSTFLVHRSGDNKVDAHRYALQFRFNDAAECEFIDRGFPTTYRSEQPSQDLITPDFPAPNAVSRLFGGCA
ncbi:phytanoyl-CoA dioxygenase family protein [Ferrovibrio sp.]|uniref:phytanoyl-CoA dioxygenase family protein n=1 Tax=Ferrovibrio sp. TaxID=1917215 RepID=UPI0035B4CB3C